MIKPAGIFIASLFIVIFYGCTTDYGSQYVKPPERKAIKHIYREQDKIVAYFAVNNIKEYQKLVPNIFHLPSKHLCRVSVIDFYDMESGPPYLESAIDILVHYPGAPGVKETLGWYCLVMPVTTEEALWGRFSWGFNKVRGKVVLERNELKYTGTSFTPGKQTPDFRLNLEVKKTELTAAQKSFLDFVSPIPALTIKDGKILNWGATGGGKYKIYELEKAAPQIWKLKFGDCSIEYPQDPRNYLSRMDLGKVIIGYWLKQRYKYSLAPK